MIRVVVWFVIAATFAGGLLAGLRWAALPILYPPQGLGSGSEADLIRARYPFHLVDPDSLKVTEDDVGFAWAAAEVKARVVAVCVAFGVLVALCAAVSMSLGRRLSANQTVQATGEDARA